MNNPALAAFVAFFGAIVGSFLNACIHRLPRGIPLGNPVRSFCPACRRTIPWYENLPVVSWIALRGKCSGCGARISPRYLVVEALTAGLFLLVWNKYGFPLAAVYWFFVALLIVATFVDIEHFIIPDEITLGGAVAGVALSAGFPEMMQASSRLAAAGLSLAGAALGYALLWLIVQAGKLAFGKKRHSFEKAEPFAWKKEEGKILLMIGEEALDWDEIFSRESDELVLECASTDRAEGPALLRFRHDRLLQDGEATPLESVTPFSGTLKAVIIPREAMGLGDVKLIAAIGAFLGGRAVLFALCAASIIGCVAALAGVFLAKNSSGARVPFGPFLALGGVLWLLWGEFLWSWYFGMIAGRPLFE